jgi:two-component system, cell cycle response regulator
MRHQLAIGLPATKERLPLRMLWAAAVLGIASFVAYSLIARGNPGADSFFNNVLYNALLLLAIVACWLRVAVVCEDRLPWVLLASAVTSWATGDILFAFAFGNDPPFPSLADAFYLAFYPLCYVGLLLLVRQHISDFNRSLWLDGVTAALAAGALGAAVLFEMVLHQTSGSPGAVITNLAYPIGDLLLISLVVFVFSLVRYRPGPMWLLLGLGFTCTAIADGIYVFEAATDTYSPGATFDVLWPTSMLLIAWAAWQPARPGRGADLEKRPLLAVPAVAGLVAIGVLVYDHTATLNALAIGLAVATLVVVMARTWLTFRENGRILERIHRQAVTDPLTKLGNRRSLVTDLEGYLGDAEGAAERMLVVFDLNGFKRYNDTFGHPSGDQLLRRLSDRLARAAEPFGAAYRLGGDEFCVLAAVPGEGAGHVLNVTSEALSEKGEGFSISTSLGAVFLPDEASTSSEALRIADERLYAQKHAAEYARGRPHGVLLQAITEREPSLSAHSRGVADLALEVGCRLGLEDRQLEELRIAAELHDVGKLAIPDAILDKPGPLTVDEWEFVERHTVVGQRIVAASPALQNVSKIIRSSHERWDGKGYPDALKGEQIPLLSRIIFPCDAYEAMTAGRPYGSKLKEEHAVAVLQRHAGTQFDPSVVSVLCDVIAARCSPSSLEPRVATRAS